MADYIRYICIILKDLLTLLQSTDLVWEIVLGDAENYWVSCIQNHDISINNICLIDIFRLNHINSIISFLFKIKIGFYRILFIKIRIIFILYLKYMFC